MITIKSQLLIALATAISLTACTVDKNNPKYDQLRYNELQDTNCHDMAGLLSSKLVTNHPEDRDVALKRCQDMKTLSYEEYQQLADYFRETGDWDFYTLFPSKRAPQQQNK